MTINAAMVKELRDASGAGMMDAKKALVESNGDMEAAVDWLRTKGLAKAAKKSDRTAAEGLVCIKVEADCGVAVEVNSETDFVAKNNDFQQMVEKIAEVAVRCDDINQLLAETINGEKVEEVLTKNISIIGEHLSIRRIKRLQGSHVSMYMHNAVSPNMGKIGVLVSLSGESKDFGKQVAMHIAATNPESLSEKDLDPALIERERTILTDQAKESGKPDNIIENMVKGRLKKYLEEVTLLNQKFVINPDQTVAEAAKNSNVEILDFIRLEVGEGIEKKEEDFASEVKKTIHG